MYVYIMQADILAYIPTQTFTNTFPILQWKNISVSGLYIMKKRL